MVIQMIVSLVAINLRAGFFATQGGAEFPLVLLAGLLSLVLSGPQHYSLDEHRLGRSGGFPPSHTKANS
jgi:uncharacterized membrane protein YphA (DoxX/SURF4 family)